MPGGGEPGEPGELGGGELAGCGGLCAGPLTWRSMPMIVAIAPSTPAMPVHSAVIVAAVICVLSFLVWWSALPAEPGEHAGDRCVGELVGSPDPLGAGDAPG